LVRIILATVILLLSYGNLPGSTISVPADSSSIQTAINGALDGDTILVADGHYFERLNLLGKSLLVTSEFELDHDTAHIGSTIIDGDTTVLGVVDTGSVIRAESFSGDVAARVQGFTIQNGYANEGGGIYCRSYDLSIEHCILSGNTAETGSVACLHYGGLALRFDSCRIEKGSIQSLMYVKGYDEPKMWESELINCELSDIHISLREPTRVANCVMDSCWITVLQLPSIYTLTNCTMHHSYTEIIDDGTVVMYSCTLIATNLNCDMFSQVEFSNCLVQGDISAATHGLDINGCTVIGSLQLGSGGGSPATIGNTILVSDGGPAISCEDPGSLKLYCCDIFGFDSIWLESAPGALDTTDVFFLDPLFCDPDSADYRLVDYSPCLPANNDCDSLIGALGMGCTMRGDADGSGQIDLDDAVFLIDYIFLNGPAPDDPDKADVNCSGIIDIDDVVFLIDYIFAGGRLPCYDPL
jgi:hypothetical protein